MSLIFSASLKGLMESVVVNQSKLLLMAYSKAVFAKGAVEAAKYLAGKPAGHYEMSDVIKATM